MEPGSEAKYSLCDDDQDFGFLGLGEFESENDSEK